MNSTSGTYIRDVQRKNSKIIIEAIRQLEKVTFEAIVDKICADFNIFFNKTAVETAVRSFLVNGYFLGFIEVNSDETFKFCDAVAQPPPASQQQTRNCLVPRAANKSSRCPKK